MEAELVKKLFKLDDDIRAGTELDQMSRKLCVKGAAFFKLENKYEISGARNVSFWKKVFNEILYP